jgi:hypothetical protein
LLARGYDAVGELSHHDVLYRRRPRRRRARRQPRWKA